MGHVVGVRLFFFSTLPKVSRALLACGPFSWKLQLGYEAMYHTVLVTRVSSQLVLFITDGLHHLEYLEGHSQPAGESLVHM